MPPAIGFPPAAAPSLLLLPDIRPGVGYGHLSRSLVVAAEWSRRGGVVSMEGEIEAPEWADRCREARGRVLAAGSAEPAEFVWTVVDGYDAGSGERARARTSPNLAAIDDHGRGGWASDVDLLIDPNVGATSDPGVRVLAGARYALIRKEVLAVAATVPRTRSVVVVGGGSPPPTVLAWMEDVAGNLPCDVDVDVVRGGRDLPTAMASAQLVVTAAGTALLEACAIGRPVVAFTWADNQRPGAAHLAEAGVEVVGDVEHTAPSVVAATVVALLDDPDRCEALRRTCASLVDGRGVRRVVSHLLGALLDVRPATAADTELLWRWANDPAVRASSFTQEPIPWDDHVRWTRAKLTDPASDIAIVSWYGRPVGQVRFDRHGARADVHVSLDRSWRGRGLGGPLLLAATDWHARRHPDVEAADAPVKVDNAASRAAFLDADFDADAAVRDRPAPHLRYSRSRNGAGPAR